MALVTWEIDSDDNDAEIEGSDSSEEQAIKHAYKTAEMYFDGSTDWAFTVHLDNGRSFFVDLSSEEVSEVTEDEEVIEAEDAHTHNT